MIRTVLGDIPGAALGFCHAHDHVLIGESVATRTNPDLLIDDVDAAIAEVSAFRRAGGGAIVDAMPLDCGRDPVGLVQVSRRTSVHIIAVTGFHTRRYYPPGHWSETMTANDLADLMAAEVTDGMDRHSHAGPSVERIEARAGVVKVATDEHGITPLAARIMEAAAECHRRTGVPVLTHTERGLFGPDQVAFLAGQGVPADAVLVSHVDRICDLGYHAELAATGAYLVYDGPSRLQYHSPAEMARCIAVAVEHGAAERVLLGMDLALRSYRVSTGGSPGLAFLLRDFLPLLRAEGFADADIRRFGWHNPAAALSIRAVARAGPGSNRPPTGCPDSVTRPTSVPVPRTEGCPGRGQTGRHWARIGNQRIQLVADNQGSFGLEYPRRLCGRSATSQCIPPTTGRSA